MTDFEQSPLDAVHRKLDAKMVPFGGWEMPLSYPIGTLDEHLACRNDAVIFDVSHLGTVRVEGSDADERLQFAFTNDLYKIAPGRAQYTHLLDEVDAPLDDANIGRFVKMLDTIRGDTQFIIITHSRKTMQIADNLYGVTMEEPGVSKLVSVKFH